MSTNGVPLGGIAQTSATRFFPGAMLSLLGLAVGFDAASVSSWMNVIGVSSYFGVALTLGFGAGLIALRLRLDPYRVGGLGGFGMGLASPFALVATVLVLGGVPATPGTRDGMVYLFSISLVVGLTSAFVLFLAWLVVSWRAGGDRGAS